MERSGYILGGMSLLTQYAETQKTNIYWSCHAPAGWLFVNA